MTDEAPDFDLQLSLALDRVIAAIDEFGPLPGLVRLKAEREACIWARQKRTAEVQCAG